MCGEESVGLTNSSSIRQDSSHVEKPMPGGFVTMWTLAYEVGQSLGDLHPLRVTTDRFRENLPAGHGCFGVFDGSAASSRLILKVVGNRRFVPQQRRPTPPAAKSQCTRWRQPPSRFLLAQLLRTRETSVGSSALLFRRVWRLFLAWNASAPASLVRRAGFGSSLLHTWPRPLKRRCQLQYPSYLATKDSGRQVALSLRGMIHSMR